MAEIPNPSEDRYAHLRHYAARQKQATVDRLSQAITQLEREKRPVTTFTTGSEPFGHQRIWTWIAPDGTMRPRSGRDPPQMGGRMV